jgi:hypothetical protein
MSEEQAGRHVGYYGSDFQQCANGIKGSARTSSLDFNMPKICVVAHLHEVRVEFPRKHPLECHVKSEFNRIGCVHDCYPLPTRRQIAQEESAVGIRAFNLENQPRGLLIIHTEHSDTVASGAELDSHDGQC